MKQNQMRRIGMILLGTFLVFGTGCAKRPEQPSQPEVELAQQGEHVTADLGEMLKVDAEIFSAPERAAYPVLQCGWDDSLTVEQAVEVLFPGEEPEITESTTDDSYIVRSYSDQGERRLGFFPSSKQIVYHDVVEYPYGVIQLYADGLRPYPESIPGVEDYEIPGYTKEQAAADGSEVLTALGFLVPAEPEIVYGVSEESLRMMFEELDTEGMLTNAGSAMPEGEWPPCYVMLWRPLLEGAPVVSGNYPLATTGDFICREGAERGSTIYMLISPEGVQVIESVGNQFEVLEKGEEQTLLPLEDVLAAVPAYYEDILLEDVRTVYRISFNYIPVLTGTEGNASYFDLIPGWCLEASYPYTDAFGMESERVEVIYVNGITGGLIR